ncbi:large exoprotein [Asticcacaulis biprosthecium C19]|uniref:Large exoprotein n=1 Tax=Asticcacaulis biprosthecium C19 TaxID=715226 RepID=F4QHJ9_9CAUL|nr:cadherin-like domain-containing protein [Asticcacaulis biprosthecium]EGF92736.1 large exoprotein [Asticcacaulis biprosthecium C19]
MALLEFSGVQTSHEVIELVPGEEIRITIKLYPEDPENVADGLDIYLLTAGESDGTGFDGYSVLYQFPGILTTESYTRITLVFTPQEGQVLGIRLNSGYTDETSFWRYTVQLGGLDSAPLIFTPTTADALRFEDPEDPDFGLSYERVHILHEDSPYGISVASTLLIHEGLRTLSLPTGTIEYYDSITDTLKPLMTVYSSDGSGWAPEVSYDNVYLAGDFTTHQALHLLGQEVFETDFKLDARGPVFGFLAEAPEEFGSFLFGSSAANPDDPVLTINDEVIGETRWQVNAQDVSFFYDSIIADILAGELTADADTSQWTLTGSFRIKSLIDNADPIKVTTAPGSLGFFNNPNEGGIVGELFSHDGTTIHIRPHLGGAEFNLGIADVSFTLENHQDFAARVGNVKIPLDLSGRYFVNPNFLQTTSSTYSGAGTHKLDGFSVMADNLEDPDPVEYTTPLAGAILDDFSLGVAGLWADDDNPTTVAAYFKFDWRGGLAGQPLAEARLTTQLTSAGLEGAVLIGMGEANSLFQGAGHGILSPYTSGFYAQVGGTFHLPYVGDVVVAQLDLTQRFGMFGKLTGKADANVILPAELMSLFALTGPLDTDLEVSIGNTEHRSGVELSAHIHSGGYDGEFGIRVRFNGTYEFLGGIVLEADAPADALGGAPGTSDEAHAFELADATALLLMRALGDLDAASVVVIAPDGTEYSGADLAAREITLIQDSGGITARVTNAEAGSWQMVAPGATDWIGFADTPDVALTVERVVTAQGETLRVTVTGPDQDYDLSILAAGDGGDALTQLELIGIRPGVHDFAVARLGLGPGDWTLGGSVSGEGQVTAEAMLGTPVAIAGAADIAVTVDIAPVAAGEEGLDLLLIRIENQGDAPAYDIEITGADGAVSASLAALLPGHSVVITADMASLGFDPDAPFSVTVAATHSSYEAAAADDSATATYEPGEAAAAILWTVDEDSSFFSSLANTVAVVTAPLHGTLIQDNSVWVYTPSPDYSGADIAVVTLNGVATRLWFDVRAINDAPTATDKTLSTGRDHTASLSEVQLLAGAIDLDQDSLSVTALGAASHGTVTTGPTARPSTPPITATPAPTASVTPCPTARAARLRPPSTSRSRA